MANPFWFHSDWINPFRAERYNWIDFAFVHASFEYDRRFGNFEFHIALAGFHVGGKWQVSSGDTQFQENLRQMMEELGLDDEEPTP